MERKALAICGSLRSDSYNLKLLNEICYVVEQQSIVVERFHGDAVEFPLVKSEKESPDDNPKVSKFHQALKNTQIILIASPEHNGGISAALKNIIDWGSFAGNPFAGKLVLLSSASTGPLAGTRGLIQLRTILSGIRCWIIPEQVQCGLADKAFDANGKLIDEKVKKQIAAAATSLLNIANKLF